MYRTIDKNGDTVGFMFSAKRDRKVDLRFFKQAIDSNGLPHMVTINKISANNNALEQLNKLFLLNNLCFLFIIIWQIKYLNNIVEQDHRHIKPTLKFKSFTSAKATTAGIELQHMLWLTFDNICDTTKVILVFRTKICQKTAKIAALQAVISLHERAHLDISIRSW